MIETDGCRTIPLEENCPPNLKLTLTQTLTLTEGQFSMGAIAIVWITKKSSMENTLFLQKNFT